MSYNTRRSGGFSSGPQPQQQQQQQNVGSIGQRRPVVTNNFVPGGQLAAQQKPVVQTLSGPSQLRPPYQQQQQGQAPQQQTGINFRNQPPQQAKPQQNYSTGLQQQQPILKTEPPVTPQKPIIPGANPPPPLPPAANGEESMDVSADGTPKKKPFWANKGNKISKKEKMRRRNLRLSRMLQPKNAVMILNELIKGCSYTVEEIPVRIDANQYKATVTFDEQTQVGLGRSKNAAKNSAAEAALKHLVKNKQLPAIKKDENGEDEQMDVQTEEDPSGQVMPWQHVASFALFKLFSSWGEDPASTNRQVQEFLGCPKAQAANSIAKLQHENKPAKKMPLNPETINPLMLINQMLPQAQFEEVGKSGNPPNVTFSYRCNADGQTFLGTGPNKKAAKKLAAFGACHKILGINYPTDVYVPIY